MKRRIWYEANEVNEMKIQSQVKKKKEISSEVQQTMKNKNDWRGKFWIRNESEQRKDLRQNEK